MADIFLSYAREDLEKARLLATGLEQQGWSVFWDRSSIHIGEDFDEVIEEAIEQARCMIVGWSQVSKKSDWVRGETTIGRERRILIPVLFEAVSPPIAFLSLHTEDFSDWQGESDRPEFLHLCKAVTRLAGTSHLHENRLVEAATASIFPASTPRVKSQPTSETTRLTFEPEMIEIPAGLFQMGSDKYDSERPIHTVTFAKPFKLGKYLVTFAEYDVFAEQTGRIPPKDEGWGRDQRPVINVSWQDAADYAAWLSKLTGKAYRLPSEAEWEYACRAGSSSEYFWGDDGTRAKQYAWFAENTGSQTQPVGQKQPNPYGLYDITGNVWEWLQDGWHDNYEGAPDNGLAWETEGDSGRRLLRGGSWNYEADGLCSAFRYWGGTGYRFGLIGFRLAQDLP